MNALRRTSLFLLLALASSPAHAQANRPDADAVRSSLEEILSLATLGTVTVRDQGAEVTQRGADYQVLLPLAGFSAPPDAAITAVARPLRNGMLDISSMTFPPEGTIEATPINGAPTRVSYSIGRQTITAKLDPNLTRPSSYVAELGNIRLYSDYGDQHGQQTFDSCTVDGTLSAEADGRLTFASQGKGTNLHLIGHGANGFGSDTTVRALAGHFSFEGLDRAQGTRLLAAARRFMADAKTPDQPSPGQLPPGQPPVVQPPAMSTVQRQELHAIIEAGSGLMNRIDAEEILQDVRFSTGAGSGTIGRVRMSVTGDALDQRLNTHLDIGMDGISAEALPAETAVYVPHHLDIRTVLQGVKIGPLMALLRAATQPEMNAAVLQAQAVALLAEPRARLSVESLTFDSGPLRVSGSARALPLANGQLGGEIHIAATGMDALLAQAESNPNLQHMLPMMFLAKGMAHPQGNSLVWDIAIDDGAITVNGVPFGQPRAKTR